MFKDTLFSVKFGYGFRHDSRRFKTYLWSRENEFLRSDMNNAYTLRVHRSRYGVFKTSSSWWEICKFFMAKGRCTSHAVRGWVYKQLVCTVPVTAYVGIPAKSGILATVPFVDRECDHHAVMRMMYTQLE